MIRRLALVAVLAVALPALVWAVMSVTITEQRVATVKKVTFVWVSASDGSALGVTTFPYDGKIIGLTTIPAAAGSAPTTLYDITVTDAGGHDVLLGAGANRSATVTEYVAEASLGAAAGSPLTLNIAAAGDTKGGTVVLFLR